MNNLYDVLRGAFIEQELQATKSKQNEERKEKALILLMYKICL